MNKEAIQAGLSGISEGVAAEYPDYATLKILPLSREMQDLNKTIINDSQRMNEIEQTIIMDCL